MLSFELAFSLSYLPLDRLSFLFLSLNFYLEMPLLIFCELKRAGAKFAIFPNLKCLCHCVEEVIQMVKWSVGQFNVHLLAVLTVQVEPLPEMVILLESF